MKEIGEIVREYAGSGAYEVWRLWRDTMLSQGREVNEKFMQLPIPERDIELDAQIAEDVVRDFLVWALDHCGLRLCEADNFPRACEHNNMIPSEPHGYLYCPDCGLRN